MSTPNEPGTPDPGSPAAANETVGRRETRRTRVGRRVSAVIRHRATAIVAAALAGLLVGGGLVAAVDGPGHRDHSDGYRGHHGLLHQPEHGRSWFGNEDG
jgi:hypothetical protein